jgi:hypothetical protein
MNSNINFLKNTTLAIALALSATVNADVTEADVNAKKFTSTVETGFFKETGKLVTYQVLDGNAIIDGDILVGRHKHVQIYGVPNLAVKNLNEVGIQTAWSGRTTWPGGVMPYTFSSEVSAADRSVILQGMSLLSAAANVSFVPRTNQTSYVQFITGGGCYSSVGRTGSRQDISIGRGCATTGIVAHELLHAFGYWHEQSRFDRDNFVQINFQNIEPGKENNFAKYDAVSASVGSYDYRSIMHYGHSAFSVNGQSTIVPRDPNISKFTLGQRNGLTAQDAAGLRAIYGSRNTTSSAIGQSSSIRSSIAPSSSSRSSIAPSSSSRSSVASSRSSAGNCTSPNFVSGTTYATGALVQNAGSEYRCTVGGWCSQGGAAYTPGTGWAWTTAWSLVRSCQ